jgi:hypothetical protein
MSNFLTAEVQVGSAAYVDLGVGPLEVGFNSGPGVSLVVADMQPAATLVGTILGASPPKLTFWQTTHVWAISIEPQPSTLNVTPTVAGAPGTAAQGAPGEPNAAWPVVLTDPAGVNQAGVNASHQLAVQLPPGAAQDGTDATGVAAPAGAAGIRGWLSGIYAKLSGALAVTGTFWPATQPIVEAAPYASTQTFVSASSGNQADADAVATLPAVADKTNYLTGLDITAAGATAASVVSPTISGILGGTRTMTFAVPAGADLAAPPLVLAFDPPLQAAAADTAITVTLPALGAGNLNATVNAQGFYQ